MRIDELCDDTLLQIFSYFDLHARRCASEVCRKWNRLGRRSWRSVKRVVLYQLFKQPRLAKGKHLNKALHWVLKRCGKYLKSLNMADPDPEYRLVKVNERTFQIIGRYCNQLEEINFTCVLLLNDLLHQWTSTINCEQLKRINLNLSFNHYCPVHDGLSALFTACPQMEYLNMSNSLNAKAQNCGEKWPTTLKEVYINNAWALTNYSLWNLVKCCPDLSVFSMCGHQCGMDAGLKFVLSDAKRLSVLRLEDYPGDTDIGIEIGQIGTLRELYLCGSSMVNDDVVSAIAKGCKRLEILDLSVPNGQMECTRHGYLTDVGLSALAYHTPTLKHLYMERRSHISDCGVSAILSNGRIETLALACSNSVTDITLQSLAAYCSHRVYQLWLTQLNISSGSILDLCRMWFKKCTSATGYKLQLHLDEIYLDIEDFIGAFQSITNNNVQEFIMDGEEDRPRRSIVVYCDLIMTMYAR